MSKKVLRCRSSQLKSMVVLVYVYVTTYCGRRGRWAAC